MVNKICIIAGEPSGDLYAGRVVAELKKNRPDLDIFGIGGEKMISGGLEAIYHLNQLSFMGIAEVVKNLPLIRRVMKRMTDVIKTRKPDVLVLVDYPGFNLKLMQKVREYCKKIVYFISPQLWAWGKHRINKIRQYVDEMLVIFPFEEDFYRNEKVNAKFVGHPLVELLDEKSFSDKNSFFQKYNFNDRKKLIAVFPGSRQQEIKKHLPVIEETVRLLSAKSNVNVGIAVSPYIGSEIFNKMISSDNVSLITDDRHNLLKYADVAVIKSGTSTVETAIFEVPMIIFYKTSWLNYNLGKHFVNIESFGMVNIIAGKKIVPELLQHEVTSNSIINYCTTMLNDSKAVAAVKHELSLVKQKLGGAGATKKVTDIILNVC